MCTHPPSTNLFDLLKIHNPQNTAVPDRKFCMVFEGPAEGLLTSQLCKTNLTDWGTIYSKSHHELRSSWPNWYFSLLENTAEKIKKEQTTTEHPPWSGSCTNKHFINAVWVGVPCTFYLQGSEVSEKLSNVVSMIKLIKGRARSNPVLSPSKAHVSKGLINRTEF